MRRRQVFSGSGSGNPERKCSKKKPLAINLEGKEAATGAKGVIGGAF